jgi:oligopeptide/dipeptide ABC transporter ATP-binding protein
MDVPMTSEGRLATVNGSGALDAPPAQPALLQVRDLSVAYATDQGPVVAVDRVSFDVSPGEFLAIVGESGCGKSTLLFAIANLLISPAKITGGSVLFDGRDMVTMGEKQLRHIRWQDYSVVMQSAMNALNPVMTIAEQMRDVCEAHTKMSKEQIAERSAEVLRLVSIDPVHLRSYPHQLSGGMRQRAMIAMALLFTPQLVIMDEPTSALDVVAQRSLMTQIKELQAELGFAVVFVTHDMSLVSHFANRLMVMYAGVVAELGSTREIFDEPRHPYSRGLLAAFPSIRGPKVALTGIAGSPPDLASPPVGCRFAPRCAFVFDECLTRPPDLYDAGRVDVRCLLYAGATPYRQVVASLDARHVGVLRQQEVPAPLSQAKADGDEAPLVEAVGLTRHFRIGGVFSQKTLHAVDDVDFAIGRKEIVALVGESGSGKSTIARLLVKTCRPTSGELLFEGKSVARLSSRKAMLAYRGKVPMVFQDPFSSINPAFRVGHAIARSIKLHRPELDRAERHAEAKRVMTAVGLVPAETMLAKFPYEMSGGQRQRVGFAQALALRPSLIVADEPVSMLDVSIRVGLLNLMVRLREQEGVSLLYITHDVASARYVADRVLVMYAGHLVEEGPAEQLLSSPRHPYTKLLLQAAPDPRAPLDLTGGAQAGEPPRVIDPRPGCRFEPRCPYAIARCKTETPRLDEVAPDQLAACFVAQAEAAGGPAMALSANRERLA